MDRVIPPLVDEAMKKAAVAWVAVGDEPPRALWCLPLAGSLYLVSGPGEQSAPGLAQAAAPAKDAVPAEAAAPAKDAVPAEAGVTVTLRGDHGGQIVTWAAMVGRVDPAGEEWASVVPQLAAKRLNAPGPTENLVARWAVECVVSRLTPAGEPVAAGATLPDSSQAAAPRPTPAARRTAKPFRLHRVRRG